MDYKHGGNIYELAIDNKEVIDFSANINPLGISKKLLESTKESLENVINYPDPNYSELRKIIGKEYKILPKNILLGNGGIQLIHNVIEFLEFNKATILVPTFVEYEKACFRFNKDIEPYFLKEEEDFKFNVDNFLMSEQSKNKLIIMCNPNNPTGYIIKKEDIIKILEILKENNQYLLLDESFMDFLDEKKSLLDQIDKFNNLIIIRSLTKFFAVPGLRLGFLATNNKKILKRIMTYRESWSVNVFANNFGKIIFDDKEYIENSNSYIKTERKKLFSELKALKIFKVYEAKANYIFFKSLVSIDWKDMLLKYKILIRSCDNYRGLDSDYYRIAVKEKKYNEYLVKCIKNIKKDYL